MSARNGTASCAHALSSDRSKSPSGDASTSATNPHIGSSREASNLNDGASDQSCCTSYTSSEDELSWINPVATDSKIAKELTELSTSDRTKIEADLHGVADPVEETEDLKKTSVQQLQEAVSRLGGRKAYEEAKSIDSSYVSHPRFLLRFLRCEGFNIQSAADRLARHFEVKFELFGRTKLCKDITQDDLESKDMKLLYSGYSQVLPLRDASNRLVWFNMVNENQSKATRRAKVGYSRSCCHCTGFKV